MGFGELAAHPDASIEIGMESVDVTATQAGGRHIPVIKLSRRGA